MCKRTLSRKLERFTRRIAMYEGFIADSGADSEALELVAMVLKHAMFQADLIRLEIDRDQRGRPRVPRPGGLLAQYGPLKAKAPTVKAFNGPEWDVVVFDLVEKKRAELGRPGKPRAGVSEAIRYLLIHWLAPRKQWSEGRALAEFEKTRNAYKRGKKIRQLQPK